MSSEKRIHELIHASEKSDFSCPIQLYDPTVGQSTVRNRGTIKVRDLMGFSTILISLRSNCDPKAGNFFGNFYFYFLQL